VGVTEYHNIWFFSGDFLSHFSQGIFWRPYLVRHQEPFSAKLASLEMTISDAPIHVPNNCRDRSNGLQGLDDAVVADIARMQDVLDALEEFEDTGVEFAMGIGDQAYLHVNSLAVLAPAAMKKLLQAIGPSIVSPCLNSQWSGNGIKSSVTKGNVMGLKVGDKAPDFQLPTKTAEGPKKLKLSDNFGKKNTVLLFFPMAFTGVCTKEMCEISQGLNAYTSLNAEVWGISGDNPFAQEAWAQKEKITVPLLSDYEHRVAGAYGVAYESFLPQLNLGMSGVCKRAAIVVDKNGIVRYAEANDDPKQLPNFEKVKATLAQIK
jgi:peroxiredoxin